jgi:hypothetical protein
MGRSVPWEQAIVASLCESKAAGLSWVAAWKLARLQNPPRNAIEREIVGAVEEFCRAAWHGERPALRHFTLAMLRDSDGSRMARHAASTRSWGRREEPLPRQAVSGPGRRRTDGSKTREPVEV